MDTHSTPSVPKSIRLESKAGLEAMTRFSNTRFLCRSLYYRWKTALCRRLKQSSRNKHRKMETVTCQLVKLEKCVCKPQEQCSLSHSSSARKYIKGKWKSLNEEVNMIEEIFSKGARKAVFPMCTVEHRSNAYKTPCSDTLTKKLLQSQSITFSLSPKPFNLVLCHGVQMMYATFRTSLVPTSIQAVELVHFMLCLEKGRWGFKICPRSILVWHHTM